MTYSYKKLWYLLIDKKMSRSELRKRAGITTNAMTKIGQKGPVSIAVLAKICVVLGCTFNDIIEFEPDENDLQREIARREYL
jgi:DNA (cytosine-5)-methyltransferase 1